MSDNITFSDAYISNNDDNRPVVILSQADVEVEAIKILQKFFNELEFASIFGPNFGPINLSAEHPFALLLFQEIVGQAVDASSMFPSITVCDSSDNEEKEVIGNTFQELVYTKNDYLVLRNQVSQGLIQVSETGMQRLATHFQNNTSAVAYKVVTNSKSSVDFNIWSQNKLVTNFIYDAIKQALKLYNIDFRKAGMEILAGEISGRKSGDYNLDFGMMLYGANLTVPVHYDLSAILVDVKLGDINDIVVNPTFHVTGEDS